MTVRGFRPLAAAALGLAGLGVGIIAEPAPRVVWNASASAPLGLYWVTHGPIERGDFVLAKPPPAARQLAAARGYLPVHVPLVKRAAALTGDCVCAVQNMIFINGREVAMRLQHDSRGRPLPAWSGCQRLGPNDVFLLMADVPDSFDGRYFGPILRGAIVGKLWPIWTFWPGREGEERDSRINKVPSDLPDGIVCTSVAMTARPKGCRHRSEKSLNSLLTKPVSDENRARCITRNAGPLSQRCRDP